jgi:hypothetical protein
MALSSLPALSTPGIYQNANQPFKTVTTQAEASFEKTFINITTRDGDTVTIKRSTSHAALSQNASWQNSNSQGIAYSGQILDSHDFSYSIQGDLSAEELQDLGELFDTLSLIAEDFFQGNVDEAVAGALNIGDMGSLSSLSATFSKSEITASRLASTHPYAKQNSIKNEGEENAIARQRQAQWQQILTYFETREPLSEHTAEKDAPEIKDHAQEMLAKIKQTLERHQRLAPLIQKLTEKAIANQQALTKPGSHENDLPSLKTKKPHEFEKMPDRSAWT